MGVSPWPAHAPRCVRKGTCMRIRAALSFSPKHPSTQAPKDGGFTRTRGPVRRLVRSLVCAPFRSQTWAELRKDVRVRTTNDMQTNEGPVKGRKKKHAHKQLHSISIFISLVLFPFSLFLEASITLTHRGTRYLQPPPFAHLAAGCGSCSRPRGGGARPQAILQAYGAYDQMI